MPQSPTLRRLMRESRELSPNPPSPIVPNPTFHAAPLSSNLHEWHFTLLGPPSTPYAGGIYHGRIVLPPTYPLRPPSFRFLTPSGRFEVNREICLSISGFHEESWQPAWGVRLALTALRVFMTEDGKGQIGGLEATEVVRKQLAERSRGWRCNGGCEAAGKTNEELMREWWECCKERGVQVGEDGEVVEGTGGEGEQIPEELRLGYRDELGGEKKEEGADAQDINKNSDDDSRVISQGSSRADQTPSINNTTPNPSASQNTDHSQPPAHSPSQSPSNTNPQSQPLPLPQPHSLPQPQPQPPQSRQPQIIALAPDQISTPYLDKAISGVIIALAFMVLKKIFYI